MGTSKSGIPARSSLRVQLTVRRLLGWVAIIGVFCGGMTWLGRVISLERRTAAEAQCSGHLCQIALALHNYHAAFGSFPPAFLADDQGKPMHSWRVLILPFLEQSSLYDAYNFAEPWNGPNNAELAQFKPLPFSCPNGKDYGAGSVQTNYLAIVGPDTIFPGSRASSFNEALDGAAATLMVAEVADSGVNWMEPSDLDSRSISVGIGPPTRAVISSHDPQGPHVILVNGERKVLNGSISRETLRALTTIKGGEAVPEGWCR